MVALVHRFSRPALRTMASTTEGPSIHGASSPGTRSLERVGAGETWERRALWVFLAFTGFALLGYGVFGLHPERLAGLGPLADFYAVSFPLFARAHIAIAALVLAVPIATRLRAVWHRVALAAMAAIVISLTAELIGTGSGLPFGEYRYSGLLGFKVADRVPMLVPLSWFLMALPAYGLSVVAFPGRGKTAPRLLFATAALVAWDLALDPAMSRLAPYWIWGQTGPYYGMPWINLFGWALTGVVIMSAFEVLGVASWVSSVPTRWFAAYYAVTVLMPLGMMAVAELWLGVVVTGVAMGALAVVFRTARSGSASMSAPQGMPAKGVPA